MLRDKQKSVMRGIIAAAALIVLCGSLPFFTSLSFSLEATSEELLTVWFQVSLVVIAWLFITIAVLARHRFFHAEDIDAATGLPSSNRARMLQAILQNTLEQCVLAIIVYGAWIIMAPQDWKLLPALFAILFSIGRLLFILRYKYGTSARSFGFALTFFPSILLLGALFIMQIMNYV